VKRSIYRASVLIFAVLFFGLGSAVMAQGLGKGMGMRWSKHAKNLENLRMLKLMELLDLNDEQSAKFIAEFVSFRKETREINEEIEQEVEALSELLKAENPADDEIAAGLARIDDLRLKRENAMKEFHKKAADILTTVQLGKMVVFQERFERELIETMRNLRERHSMPPGP
jgi:Spy/CpxP family protein refolding chaperone